MRSNHGATYAVPPFGGNNDLTGLLLERVRRLDYRSFVECVRQTLAASGFHGVVSRRVGMKGKNAGGGWDIEAHRGKGIAQENILVQVKRNTEPVQARYVDELRGAAMRSASTEAMIVTDGSFSPAALKAASEGRMVSIHLVDGEHLAGLMRSRWMGVRRSSNDPRQTDRWIVDDDFFDRLQSPKEDMTKTSANDQTGIKVTISINPGSRYRLVPFADGQKTKSE